MQANATRQPSRTAAAPSRRGVIAQESSQSVPRAQVGARALEQRDGARVDVEHHRAELGHGEAHRGAVVGAGAPVARPVARPGLSEKREAEATATRVQRQQAIEAAAKQRAEERRRQAEEDAARRQAEIQRKALVRKQEEAQLKQQAEAEARVRREAARVEKETKRQTEEAAAALAQQAAEEAAAAEAVMAEEVRRADEAARQAHDQDAEELRRRLKERQDKVRTPASTNPPSSIPTSQLITVHAPPGWPPP